MRDIRNNHDFCVECGKLVGSNPDCENCLRVTAYDRARKITRDDTVLSSALLVQIAAQKKQP